MLHLAATFLMGIVAVKATPASVLVAAILLQAAVGAPVSVLADTAVSAATTDSHQYGQARLWGAVAWGAVSAFAGSLLQIVGFRGSFLAFFVPATLGDVHNSSYPVEIVLAAEASVLSAHNAIISWHMLQMRLNYMTQITDMLLNTCRGRNHTVRHRLRVSGRP
jgi:MFS family permease